MRVAHSYYPSLFGHLHAYRRLVSLYLCDPFGSHATTPLHDELANYKIHILDSPISTSTWTNDDIYKVILYIITKGKKTMLNFGISLPNEICPISSSRRLGHVAILSPPSDLSSMAKIKHTAHRNRLRLDSSRVSNGHALVPS